MYMYLGVASIGKYEFYKKEFTLSFFVRLFWKSIAYKNDFLAEGLRHYKQFISSIISNLSLHSQIPVLINLSQDADVNLPVKPLIFALAMGACLGGKPLFLSSPCNKVKYKSGV